MQLHCGILSFMCKGLGDGAILKKIKTRPCQLHRNKTKRTIRYKLIIMDSFYVYVNSGYTQLAKLIHLDGKWEVAVTQIHIENNNISPRHFAIVANFVDVSLVNDTTLPILRWTHFFKS